MKLYLYPFLFVITLVACSTPQRGFNPAKVSYSQMRITDKTNKDANLVKLLAPYKDSVNNSMNGVIATLQNTMEKRQPEGSLGNFVTDAQLIMGAEKFKRKVDLSIVNNGGIRLQELTAGAITRGKIFELMPFDNELIMLTMSGKNVQQLLDTTSKKGGWPISGTTYTIENKKATNILIGGAPIDEFATYNVVLSDYLANGGDNLDFLKALPRVQKGYLLRDAIIDYVTKLNISNPTGIPLPTMGRIVYIK